jgi:ATP-dependent DNA helicase RecQ
LVTYNFRKNAGQIQFLIPREDNSTIHKIASNIKQHNTIKSNKINAVIDYVNNKTICRSNYLLNYFSETNTQACGICDICTNANKKPSNSSYKELSIKILALLSVKQSLSSKEIIANFELDSSIILTTLQLLLDTDKISINSQNKLEKV